MQEMRHGPLGGHYQPPPPGAPPPAHTAHTTPRRGAPPPAAAAAPTPPEQEASGVNGLPHTVRLGHIMQSDVPEQPCAAYLHQLGWTPALLHGDIPAGHGSAHGNS